MVSAETAATDDADCLQTERRNACQQISRPPPEEFPASNCDETFAARKLQVDQLETGGDGSVAIKVDSNENFDRKHRELQRRGQVGCPAGKTFDRPAASEYGSALSSSTAATNGNGTCGEVTDNRTECNDKTFDRPAASVYGLAMASSSVVANGDGTSGNSTAS